MAVKGIKETEKIAVGATCAVLQTWLAPQLSEISQRLTHVEARLEVIDRRFEGIDQRIEIIQQQMAEQFRSMHNEFEARIDAVQSEIKHLDIIAELRERLASVEAKLTQRN